MLYQLSYLGLVLPIGEGGFLAHPRGCGKPLMAFFVMVFFQAADKLADQGVVQLSFEKVIFNTTINAWIVVHLNDKAAPLGFLEIHAIKAVAHQVGGPQR
ncbi:unnamed protein product [Pararhodospirillum photometricum DSM 122]|uniref:Uncharacterized protein n=1 Tax=Pararhodospirillum photometricum DSM 122 TaxID=1150469 RepID=H6SNQ4_PARPM|nr:unnamed protein product [Pararhodospirillum photometricum DSM 122]